MALIFHTRSPSKRVKSAEDLPHDVSVTQASVSSAATIDDRENRKNDLRDFMKVQGFRQESALFGRKAQRWSYL